MRRYLYLLWIQWRASLATSMQYRLDFLIDGFLSLWWTVWPIVPLLVVYSLRAEVGSWSLAESLIVIGWFTLLRGFLEGVINPSLIQMVEHIRNGTLDFVLVKPADAQFLVSTAKFSPWKIFDVGAGVSIVALAFFRLGRVPEPAHMLLAAVLLLCAMLVLYSLWILVVCASFWVVRIDNLSHLFNSIFDAARWPISFFRGFWRILFTFIIPLGVMTSYPAMAILGTLHASMALYAASVAVALAVVSRLVWKEALGKYTSASS
jgi:ABC-2 type transport system permease protein